MPKITGKSPTDIQSVAALRESTLQGWNTWNFRSMTSHVHLPTGFAINLRFKEYARGQILPETLVGRKVKDCEVVVAGPRSYDGSYSELTIDFLGLLVKVETTAVGDEFTCLVTPLGGQPKPGLMVVEGVVMFGESGQVVADQETLVFDSKERRLTLSASGPIGGDPYHGSIAPHLSRTLSEAILISTDSAATLSGVREKLDLARQAVLDRTTGQGDLHDLELAVNSVLAWNTVYDPLKRRIISPCGRMWCHTHGGYALFCWDTFFAARMALDHNPELAVANVIAILEEIVPEGFVPNYSYATGQASLDRSQPPVGGLMAWQIYEATGWDWFLAECFDRLLRWNRWWVEQRDWDGYLCWGSNPFSPSFGNMWETLGVGETYGAALESGLDNSPMFDDIPFDSVRGMIPLADVGLMSLVIADCRDLAKMARILGRPEAEELESRRAALSAKLLTLWDEATGMFLNKRLDTGEFSPRLSPTLFYPLLAEVATSEQAKRMVADHMLNPDEFWGEFVLPSIARNDPAFPEQDYWRGRVWAPLNFLVYLGLRNYPELEVRQEFVARSSKLLLGEWREEGHIHENYNALTGDGDDIPHSDPFHHWGGLLALIALMENQSPEKS